MNHMTEWAPTAFIHLIGHIGPGCIFFFFAFSSFYMDLMCQLKGLDRPRVDSLIVSKRVGVVMLASLVFCMIMETNWWDGSGVHMSNQQHMMMELGFVVTCALDVLYKYKKIPVQPPTNVCLGAASLATAVLFSGHPPQTLLEGRLHLFILLATVMFCVFLFVLVGFQACGFSHTPSRRNRRDQDVNRLFVIRLLVQFSAALAGAMFWLTAFYLYSYEPFWGPQGWIHDVSTPHDEADPNLCIKSRQECLKLGYLLTDMTEEMDIMSVHMCVAASFGAVVTAFVGFSMAAKYFMFKDGAVGYRLVGGQTAGLDLPTVGDGQEGGKDSANGLANNTTNQDGEGIGEFL